jgi:ArsR family transcriptional regulator
LKNEYFRVFRAFADPNRLRVLELLCEGERCACILLSDLRISQPTLSHHMKILCDSGLVKSRRVGKWNYYSIDADGCAHGGRLLNALADRKPERLLRIARRALSFPRTVARSVASHPDTDDARKSGGRCCCGP